MTVYVVSKKAAVRHFAPLRQAGRFAVQKLSVKALHERLDAGDAKGAFFYLHAASFPDGDLAAVVERISACAPGRAGVFDPEGAVGDPAVLFFLGASDYLSGQAISGGLSVERFESVLRFARLPLGGVSPAQAEGEAIRSLAMIRASEPISPPRLILSGGDWASVAPGREYTFWFLHIELEGGRAYMARSSDAVAIHLSERFRDHLLSEVERFGGRIWMWKRYSGLLLFPFDGERCTPIIPIFRLMMNRVVANAERYKLKSPVSYHLALHLGNVVYQESGRTGEIVSEDVNFVFHLADQFTDSGEATITEIAMSYVPEGLYDYFLPKGRFEGVSVYRMRRVHVVGRDDQRG